MKKVILSFAVVILLATSHAYALKRFFPDPHSLQPIPITAHPDISGNLNRNPDAVATTPMIGDTQPIDSTSGVNDQSQIDTVSTESSISPTPAQPYNFTSTLLYGALALLIIAGLLRVKRSLN